MPPRRSQDPGSRRWPPDPPPPAASGPLAAAGIAVAASVLMTWPLAREASDHVLRAIYHWDAYTNAMISAAASRGARPRPAVAI
jgi:hypothetical protein